MMRWLLLILSVVVEVAFLWKVEEFLLINLENNPTVADAAVDVVLVDSDFNQQIAGTNFQLSGII